MPAPWLALLGLCACVAGTSVPRTPAEWPMVNMNSPGGAVVVSFSQDNAVFLNGEAVGTIDSGDVLNLAGTKNGDVVNGTGPLMVYSPSVGSRFQVWPSEMFAGTLFACTTNRDSPLYVVVHALCGVKGNTTACVDVTIHKGAVLAAGDNAFSLSHRQTRVAAITDVSGRAIVVRASAPVLVFLHSDSRDARPCPPASHFAVGIASSRAYGTAVEDGVTAAVYGRNGLSSASANIRFGDDFSEGGTRQFEDSPLAVVASGLVGFNSLADADGSEATPFLPRYLMSTEFVVPTTAEFVALAAVDPPRPDAFVRVEGLPEEGDWDVVLDLNLPVSTVGNWTTVNDVPYTQRAESLPACKSHRRVAYRLQLDDDWVWASASMWLPDPVATAELGVPVGAFKHERSVSGVIAYTGSGSGPGTLVANGVAGRIEFYSDCYTTGGNSAFDASDTASGTPNCYGSMQLHAGNQELFAVNGFAANVTLDVGILSGPSGFEDWTQQHNAGAFTTRKLTVYAMCDRYVDVEVTEPGGVSSILTLTRHWHTPSQYVPLFARIPTLGDGSVARGTTLKATAPMWAIFEDRVSDDETIMFGFGDPAPLLHFGVDIPFIAWEGRSNIVPITLFTQPTAEVLVTVQCNTSDIIVSPSQFNFTPSTWNTPKLVSFAIPDDNVDEPRFVGASCMHSFQSADVGYGPFSTGTPLAILIRDDEEVPGTPTLDSSKTRTTGGAVLLVWRPPAVSGSSPIHQFVVEMRLSGTQDAFVEVGRTQFNDSSASEFLVGGLSPSTRYDFRVAALNIVGMGAWSQVEDAFTREPTPPGPPAAPFLRSASGGSITIGWTAPVDTGGIQIAGYIVYLDGVQVAPAIGSPPSALLRTFTFQQLGLRPITAYRFQIVAVNELAFCVGNGQPSSNATFSTLRPTPPGPAAGLLVANRTGGAIRLLWQVPDDTGGVDVTGYRVVLTGANTSIALDQRGNNATSAFFVGLRPETNYSITVVALNFVDHPDRALRLTAPAMKSAGTAAVWNSSGFPDFGISSAVQFRGGSSDDQANPPITVELWLNREKANSSAVELLSLRSEDGQQGVSVALTSSGELEWSVTRDGVLARASLRGQAPIPLGWSHIALVHPGGSSGGQLTGFVDGQSYGTPVLLPSLRSSPWANVTLVRFSEAFASVRSVQFDHFRLWVTPRSISQIRATLLRPLRLVSPDESGLIAALDFDAESDSLDIKSSVVSLRARLTGIGAGSMIALEESERGFGAPSAPLLVTTTAPTPPGQPDPPFLRSATGGRLDVGWMQPDDIGGVPLTRADVERNDGDGTSPTRVVSASLATSASVFSLLANTGYVFRVRFVNAAGEGPWSSLRTISTSSPTPPGLPPAPRLAVYDCDPGFTTVALPSCNPTATRIDLVWDTPPDTGGIPVSRFTVEQLGAVVFNGTATADTRLGLSPGTSFAYRYFASNAVGSGPRSPILNVTTSAFSKPGPPIHLSVVSRTGGALQLAWDLPQDTGGRPLTGYRLFRVASPSQDLAACNSPSPGSGCSLDYDGATSLTRSAWVWDLRAAKQYSFAVLALSTASSGVWGTLSHVHTNQTSNVSAPGIMLAPVFINETLTSLAMSWARPRDTGGVEPTDLEYVLLVRNNSAPGNVSSVYSGSNFAFDIGGLIAGETYAFFVRARNQAGDGPLSTPLVRTLKDTFSPAAPQLVCRESSRVSVSWDAPVLVRGVTYIAYRFYARKHGTEAFAVIGEVPYEGLDAELSGFDPSTDYSVFRTLVNDTVEGRGEGPPSPLLNFTTLASPGTAECVAQSGSARSGRYSGSTSFTWSLRPTGAAAMGFIRVTFSTFELECDHDQVQVGSTAGIIWTGGCSRPPFTVDGPVAGDRNVTVNFTSDATIGGAGVSFSFEFIPDPGQAVPLSVACPVWQGRECSGASTACASSGECTCRASSTGEDCSGAVLCPTPNPSGLCARLDRIIAVSPTGDDEVGTGFIGSPVARPVGRVGKPVASLRRALALSRPGDAIGVFPGEYDWKSCQLNFTAKNVTVFNIGSTQGGVVDIDCNGTWGMRFAEDSSSLSSLVFRNVVARQAAWIDVVSGSPMLEKCRVENAAGSQSGGAIVVAQGASLNLRQVTAINVTSEGSGGFAAVNGSLQLMGCSIGHCTASRDGGCLSIESGGVVRARSASSFAFGSAGGRGGIIAVTGEGSRFEADHFVTMLSGHAVQAGGCISVGNMGSAIGSQGASVSRCRSAIGGAFVLYGQGTSVRHWEFSDAIATSSGGLGALLADGVGTLGHLNATRCSAPEGGGLSVHDNAELSVESLRLDDANATGVVGGGGASARKGAIFSSVGSTFRRTHALVGPGGFLSCVQSTCSVVRSTISDASAVSGGALAIRGVGALLSVEDVSVQHCSAQEGGALSATDDARLIINGTSALVSNTAQVGGGVFAGSGAHVAIAGPHVKILWSTATVGGGIAVNGSGSVVRGAGVEIALGTAADDGGGVSASHGARLELNDGTSITHNRATGGSGGGVVCTTGASVHLASLDLTNNVAAGSGGGLSATECANLSVTGVNVSHNVADVGGGLHCASEVALLRSVPDVVLSGVRVLNNSALTSGGGLSLNSVRATLLSATVATNTASGGSGGGLHCVSCDVRIDHSDISQNTAFELGGGIASSAGSAKADIISSRLLDNAASGGGAISLRDGGNTTFTNALVQGNRALSIGGGGAYLRDGSFLHSIADASRWLNNSAPSSGGGAILAVTRSIARLDQGDSFSGNSAREGGAVSLREGSQGDFSGATWSLNVAQSCGGALHTFDEVTVHIINSSFTANRASSGAAICAQSSAQVFAQRVNCTGNTVGGSGGCIFASDDSTLALTGGVAEKNSAQNGGALAIESRASVRADRWECSENAATQDGGGVIVSDGGSLTLFGSSSLTANTARGRGGSVAVSAAIARFLSGRDERGRAASGGSVYGHSAARLEFARGWVLKEGRATHDGGCIAAQGSGTVAVLTPGFSLIQCTAGIHGGGLSVSDGAIGEVHSVIMVGHVAGRGGAISVTTLARLNLTSQIMLGTSASPQPGAGALSDGHGGAIYANGGRLNGTAVTCNETVATDGGCIYSTESEVVFVGLRTIATRAAQQGGSVVVSGGSLVVSGWVGLGARAGILGGAMVCNSKATVSITGSRLTQSWSGQAGGCIVGDDAVLLISNSTFDQSTAITRGGGLLLQGRATATVSNSVLSGSIATSDGGGGIAVLGGASLALTSSRMEDNSATGNGGQILALDEGRVVLQDVLLRGPRDPAALPAWAKVSSQFGGALYAVGANVEVQSSSILGHQAVRDGGGVFGGRAAYISIRDSRVGGNAGESGGAVFAIEGAQVTVVRSQIEGNSATFDGGAVYLDGVETTINSTFLRSNTAGASGGHIYLGSGSRLTLADATLAAGTSGFAGGGLFVGRGSSPSVIRCSFSGNSARETGGGMHAELNTVNIGQGTSFTENTAERGGGLFLQDASASVSGAVFSRNEARAEGGAVAVSGSESTSTFVRPGRTGMSTRRLLATTGGLPPSTASSRLTARIQMVGCTVAGNRASDGGGVAAEGAGGVDISVGTVVSGNTAIGRGGGVFATGHSVLFCFSAAVASNTAGASGGGGWVGSDASVNLTACALTENRAARGGGGMYIGSTVCVPRLAPTGAFVNASSGDTLIQAQSSVTAQLRAGDVVRLAPSDDRYRILEVRSSSILLTTAIRRDVVLGSLDAAVPEACTDFDSVTARSNAALEGGAVFWEYSPLYSRDDQLLTCRSCTVSSNICEMDGRSAVSGIVRSACPSSAANSGECSSVDGQDSFFFGRLGEGPLAVRQCRAACQSVAGCTAFALISRGSGLDSSWHGHCYGRSSALPLFTSEPGVTSGLVRSCDFSTGSVGVRVGWFPDSPIQSGRPLLRSGVLGPSASEAHLVVHDAYDSPSISDVSSTCSIWRNCGSGLYFDDSAGECKTLDGNTANSASGASLGVTLLAGGAGSSVGGAILFPELRIRADTLRNYSLQFNCTIDSGAALRASGVASSAATSLADTVVSSGSAGTISDGAQVSLQVPLAVQRCDRGFELTSERICAYCPDGKYSVDGRVCLDCPFQSLDDRQSGANCTRFAVIDGQRLKVGTAEPQLRSGWWRDVAQSSVFNRECPAAVLQQWDDDVCPPGTSLQADGLCRELTSWSPERIYRCTTGAHFYRCPLGDAACTPREEGNETVICNRGYSNILCAICEDGFYESADSTCDVCTGNGDPQSVTLFYSLIFTFSVAVGVSLVVVYLREDGTRRLQQILTCGGCKVCRRKRWKVHAEDEFLDDIPEEQLEKNVWFRAEKWKIMVGFAQVFSQYRNTYDIYWPPVVEDIMRRVNIFNLDVLKIAALDCIYRADYFRTFYLVMGMPVVILLFVGILFLFGRWHYTKRMRRHPRLCLHSGKMTPMATTEHVMARAAKVIERAHVVGEESQKSRRAQAKVQMMYGEQGNMMRAGTDYAGGGLKTFTLFHPKHENPPDPPLLSEQQLKSVVYTNARSWKRRVIIKLEFLKYRNKALKLGFWAMLLSYVSVSNRVLRLYNCTEIGDKFFLASDYRLECFTGEHFTFMMLGIPVIVLYVLGTPFMFWFLLWRARNRNVAQMWGTIRQKRASVDMWVRQARKDAKERREEWKDPASAREKEQVVKGLLKKRNMRRVKTKDRLGFIYASFRDEVWWYEVWDFVRKLLSTAVMALVAPGSMTQVVLGLLVMLGSSVVCLTLKPYEVSSDSLLANACLIELFLILFSGFLLKVDAAFIDDVGDRSTAEIEVIQWIVVASLFIVLCFGVGSVVVEKVSSDIEWRRRVAQQRKNFARGRMWNAVKVLRTDPSKLNKKASAVDLLADTKGKSLRRAAQLVQTRLSEASQPKMGSLVNSILARKGSLHRPSRTSPVPPPAGSTAKGSSGEFPVLDAVDEGDESSDSVDTSSSSSADSPVPTVGPNNAVQAFVSESSDSSDSSSTSDSSSDSDPEAETKQTAGPPQVGNGPAMTRPRGGGPPMSRGLTQQSGITLDSTSSSSSGTETTESDSE